MAGRMLPAMTLALLSALSVVHAAERPGRRPDQGQPPIRAEPPTIGVREPSRGRRAISVDQAIAQVERRYNARVVRAEQAEFNGRRIYVMRLLSEEGRVWTVRVDAETGGVM